MIVLDLYNPRHYYYHLYLIKVVLVEFSAEMTPR